MMSGRVSTTLINFAEKFYFRNDVEGWNKRDLQIHMRDSSCETAVARQQIDLYS